MKREFNYGYNNSIMAIHAKVELEIVDMFKENGVNKIHLDDGEDGINEFTMAMFNDFDGYATTEHITDIEIEVETNDDNEIICVVMRLYCENGDYFLIDDSVDGNAILRVYERVYQHFYSVRE